MKTQQSEKITQPQEVDQVTFVLLDQQQSNYFRDEDPETSNSGKVFLSTCDRKIPVTSKVRFKDPNTGIIGLRETRYIKGCPTIFVDEQKKGGWTPNPIADAIWLTKGKLTVMREESGVELLEYLQNGCSANRDCKNRTESYAPIFGELDTAVETAADEQSIDDRYKAIAYMQSLKTESRAGKYSYNEDALEFLAHLFKLPAFDSGFGSGEAWVALASKAEANPAVFINTIQKEKQAIEATVHQAIALKAIHLDTAKAMLGDEKQTVVMIFPDGLSENQAVSRLVDFYSNPSNRAQYGAVSRMISVGMTKAAQVIK